MKSAFDKIAAGLEDAIAFAGGETDRGMIATVDVRAVRNEADAGRVRQDVPLSGGNGARSGAEASSAGYGVGLRCSR